MISVKNLSYTYAGSEKAVLNDLTFTIPTGSIFGFLGPSGAGKSTTQKILMGLLSDYSGEILFNGSPLNSKEEDFYRSLGVAFDVPRFYPKLSGRENLGFFADLYGVENPPVETLLDQVGLLDAADQRVDAYSKGMTIRLNLCRALIHDPAILFLDEPTSGLDPVLSKRIREIIAQEKQKGKTIFLTTHHMETANELCDQVAFLVDGTIALCDAPVNIRNRQKEREVILTCGKEGHYTEEVLPQKALHKNPRFLSLMEAGKIAAIHTREVTLEDTFAQVTGHRLLEGDF